MNNEQRYLYAIDPQEVKFKSMSGIRTLLQGLKVIGPSAHKKLVLSFSGYDDIPDELYEIQEVRFFIYRMLRDYPEVLYFIDPGTEMIIILMAAIGDLEVKYSGEPTLSPEEYHEKGYGFEDLPRKYFNYIRVPEQVKKNLIAKLLEFGQKIGDPEGVQEVIFEIEFITKEWK